MNNKYLKILKTIFISIIIIAIAIAIKSYKSDSSLEFISKFNVLEKNNWISLLDYSSNSYYMWKFGYGVFNISLTISNLLNANFNFVFYYTNLVIFGIFLFLLIKSINKKTNNIISVFLTLNFIVLIAFLFGNKTYLISSIPFLPLYILSLINLYKSNKFSFKNILFFALTSILLIHSANQLSFLYIIFSLIILYCINNVKIINTKSKNILIFFSIFYSLYYIIFQIPYLPKFDFPWYARVVQDDGLPGILRPLLNESSQIPYIDEISEKTLYAPFVLLLSIYILFVINKYLRSKDFSSKMLSYTLIFFILSLLVEIFLPSGLASIFLFKTIWRIIPGIYTLSLYPIFIFLMLLVFFIFTIINLQNFIFICLINVLLITAALFNNYRPIFISNDTINFINQIKNYELVNTKYKDILLSPSSAVIKALGIEYLEQKDVLLNNDIYRNIKIVSPKLYSNYGQESLHQLLNKNSKKRYSTFKGKQDGDEWIKIELPKFININGIMLDTGVYKTDFPSEILVKDCNNNTLSKQKNLGNFEFTVSGYPYYGGQNKVTILFKDKVNTNCIKIYQTGNNNHFEWSITQIKFLLPDNPRKNLK